MRSSSAVSFILASRDADFFRTYHKSPRYTAPTPTARQATATAVPDAKCMDMLQKARMNIRKIAWRCKKYAVSVHYCIICKSLHAGRKWKISIHQAAFAGDRHPNAR